MAQATLKDYFGSQKKKEDKDNDVSRKRSLESYAIPRGKKRKVASKPTVKKEKATSASSSSTKGTKARSQPSLTVTSLFDRSTKKVEEIEGETESAVTKSSASPTKDTKAVSPPLSRGAACLKLLMNKNKISSQEQVKSFEDARRKLFSEPEASSSGSSSSTFEDKKDKALPLHTVRTSHMPSPTKKQQQSTTEKSAPKLGHFKALQYDSPTKKKPCYEKYESCLEPDLPLPKHYGLLAEKFHFTDTVVNMIQKRGETCTFLKLKDAVQQMNRRLFEKCDLSKMKTVYPNALIFDQQTHIPGMYGYACYNSYQLTVKVNTEETGDSDATSNDGDIKEQPRLSTRPPHLASSILLKRRQRFRRNLVGIVKEHHKEFLASLNPPVTSPNKIDRWHPSFPLELIADIKESPLPVPPDTPTISSARDLLNIASYSMAPCVKQALENVAESKPTAPAPLPEPAVVNPAIEKALKGIPQSIIDKIKAKEADKAMAAMTRDPVRERKLGMLTALPEMCRIIRTFFVAEKKAAIPVEQVIEKLIDSSGYAADNIEGHLALIEEVLPDWYRTVTVRKCSYVKVDRKMELKKLLDRIELKTNELSK